ncbi:exonuclease [Gordonia phage CloverMinnie]|nr:exonuclease [Gordonia phage CloverMinnie]
MATIAEQWPVQPQTNGTAWYRPEDRPMDGWTSDPLRAHHSYFSPGATDEDRRREHEIRTTQGGHRPDPQPQEDSMTVIDDSGAPVGPVRATETMGYPLPPEPPRVKVVYDGWGRYKLPSPSTGRPTGFTRATTVASVLDDTYNLNRWKRRETAKRVMLAAELAAAGKDFPTAEISPDQAMSALEKAVEGEDNKALDRALDVLDDNLGGRDAAELGTAVHAWIEAVDIGMVRIAEVPEMFQPYIAAYQEVLRRHGLIALPEYVERIVLNDRGEETIVGTLDRIYLVVATGDLLLGDVKTSKTLEYGYLSYAVQLAVYGYAPYMLGLDGKTWEPAPKMIGLPHPSDAEVFADNDGEDPRPPYGVIIHVPSDQPERASAVTMDLWFGAETMVAALETRRRRKLAPKQVPYVHALPTPSKAALRYVEARQALQNISAPDELNGVWEQYQDVWDDALTQLGEQIAALF